MPATFTDIDRAFLEMDAMLRGFEPWFNRGVPATAARAIDDNAAVEVTDENEHWKVTAWVPGVDPASIELNATPEGLTLTATRTVTPPEGFRALRRERSDWRLSRQVAVPGRIDPDAVEATLKDGVLTVLLRKHANERPRKIDVKAG